MPAQQVGRQTAEVGPEPSREFTAVAAGDGTQIEVDVDTGGGARPRPIPGTAAGKSGNPRTRSQ
ncbi:hypothetical protein [Streptomyces sp. NPDC001843]|uniref:hypothetical protein n=1 Tax=Streptomyces sp. NPDC001843 TaxID=3364617 RepID=UPI0036B33CD1